MAGRVGLTMMWTRLVSPLPLSVSATIQRTVVAGSERSRTCQLLAGLERDVRDLSRCGVDLIESTGTVGKDLDGVEISGSAWLDARGIVGRRDPFRRLFGFFITLLAAARRGSRREERAKDARGRPLASVDRETLGPRHHS